MVMLLLVFHVINSGVLFISEAIIGGGFSQAAISNGSKIVEQTPVMRLIYGYAFPFAGGIAAFGTGLIVTRMPVKDKLRLKGFCAKDFFSGFALTFSLATAASIVTSVIISIIALMAGTSEEAATKDMVSSALLTSAENPLWVDILIYTYACLLGPVIEELVFRGVMLEGLRKYGNSFGIIASALMFGLAHGNYMQFLPTFTIGLVWGYLAVKTGSLLPSIILHIINNSLSSLLTIILTTGINSSENIYEAAISLMTNLPLMSALVFNVILRIVCIIASIVIMFRFFGSGKRLISSGEYCRKRTWRYFFTSVPWLICMIYQIAETVTSISF